MKEDMKEELNQLYTKKGELITGIEVMSKQLEMVNQQIYKMRNDEINQSKVKQKKEREL